LLLRKTVSNFSTQSSAPPERRLSHTINLITGITIGTCSCQNQQTIPDDTCLCTHWYLSIRYRPNFRGPVD
jgi:hypothetical protein